MDDGRKDRGCKRKEAPKKKTRQDEKGWDVKKRIGRDEADETERREGEKGRRWGLERG